MNEKFAIDLEDFHIDEIAMLCGNHDQNLQILQEQFSCQLILRNQTLLLLHAQQEQQQQIQDVVRALHDMMANDIEIQERDVLYACMLAKKKELHKLASTYQKPIGKTMQGKWIYPKTIGQRYLFQCMSRSDITFASGVAGTGKTYLAVVYAVQLLKQGEIQKIILTRPAVEAGESLGFLPGDLKEKVDPYLRPLYDALYDTLGSEQVEKLLEKQVIEIAPLAYMRGRTLDRAFIILDEAQNTTRSQMKMFLTRMGFQSKIVITGDLSQIDLIRKKDSGLKEAKEILEGIDGISFVELTSMDVVRHPLVQKIIERYEAKENESDTDITG